MAGCNGRLFRASKASGRSEILSVAVKHGVVIEFDHYGICHPAHIGKYRSLGPSAVIGNDADSHVVIAVSILHIDRSRMIVAAGRLVPDSQALIVKFSLFADNSGRYPVTGAPGAFCDALVSPFKLLRRHLFLFRRQCRLSRSSVLFRGRHSILCPCRIFPGCAFRLGLLLIR